MYITIKDCSSFKMYIRSYAESNYDYVMVSQLDKTINGNTSYSDTTLVKAHTRGNQQSGAALSSYKLVMFTEIPSGEHTITVVYRKDTSANSGDDRGYVLIEKQQAGYGDKIVNNIYQSFVEDGPDVAFIITSEYPVTSNVFIYDGYGLIITGINIGKTQSDKYYMSVDTTSTYISPTEDDTYIYNLVKD